MIFTSLFKLLKIRKESGEQRGRKCRQDMVFSLLAMTNIFDLYANCLDDGSLQAHLTDTCDISGLRCRRTSLRYTAEKPENLS